MHTQTCANILQDSIVSTGFCVAVICSDLRVLQCAAECCSMLQCAAVPCPCTYM